nr:MAG TPA_asm: hypothetical protein [Caudoviricetes sp.]
MVRYWVCLPARGSLGFPRALTISYYSKIL